MVTPLVDAEQELAQCRDHHIHRLSRNSLVGRAWRYSPSLRGRPPRKTTREPRRQLTSWRPRLALDRARRLSENVSQARKMDLGNVYCA